MKETSSLKISIITVSYNNVKTIEDTIESVLTQTYENIEYIVVDGCSSDDTLDVLEKNKNNIGHLIIENDRGMYDALNKGIQISSGNVIGILHADDAYKDSNVIANIMKCFNANEAIDICLSDIAFFSGRLDKPKIIRKMSAKNFRPWQLRFGWMPPHPGMFIKKNVFKKIGLYKLSYKIAADYEFSLRAFLTNKTRHIITNYCSVLMREGGASTKNYKSNFLITKEIIKACEENKIYTNTLFVISRLPIKVILKIMDRITSLVLSYIKIKLNLFV